MKELRKTVKTICAFCGLEKLRYVHRGDPIDSVNRFCSNDCKRAFGRQFNINMFNAVVRNASRSK